MTAISLIFESTLSDGFATLTAATGFLQLQGAYSEDIELVLAEAINNIVDHAYSFDNTANLDICATENAVHCALTDWGDLYGPPQTDMGYGWQIITSLAEKCDFMRSGKCNRLLLQFVVPVDSEFKS